MQRSARSARKDVEVRAESSKAAKTAPVAKAQQRNSPPSRSMLGGIAHHSTGGVVILLCAWGLYSARIFYDLSHPTFPEFDHMGRRVETFGSRVSPGTPLNLKVYLSEDTIDINKHTPIWDKDFAYDWDTFQAVETTVPISISQQLMETSKNLHLWALVFSGDGQEVLTHSKGSVVKYITPPPITPKFKLLSGTECPAHEEKKYGKKKEFARGIPKMQLRFVDDQTKYPATWGYTKPYVSPIFVDEFWLTDDQLVKLNATGVNKFDLLLHFDLMSSARWHFQRQMSARLANMAQSFGEDSEEILQMRDLFANTSAWLLILTFVISFLHMIFEYLAFKNDVIFWKNQSTEDLNKYVSVQSVLVGVICQILLLMYLWDESANILVLITSLASIVIDIWKVTRAMKLQVGWLFKIIPYPFFQSRAKREKVDNFDSQAMKYLSVIISPVLMIYSVYSLTQDCHKGWYSYGLSCCASCVYSLGFILMTPQLFINYKYKTVQFLPWRRFIYRAINTFIDDLFSFIIRMPTMHRLSCFRDDIVFFIYLYQRWIYPVDKHRLFDEEGYELANTDEKETKNDKKNI
eukprot:GEMP01024242.1.p1 GENE.GEMP01024242.1~~GEMP01024242.1.p1  ORF type:complete len:577 (+),score=61.66 GEMP01024242.1:18-1748(+)